MAIDEKEVSLPESEESIMADPIFGPKPQASVELYHPLDTMDFTPAASSEDD